MRDITAYADVITANVQHLLPRCSEQAYAVSIRIQFDDHHSEEERPTVGGFLHLACHAPSNYMAVYAAFTERPDTRYAQLPWTLMCCHDSAWRDDGIRSTLRRAWRDIEAYAERFLERPAGELSPHVSIDCMRLGAVRELLGLDLLSARSAPGRIDVTPELDRALRR